MQNEHQKQKKILIATGLYPPDIGGPATYVKMLEKYLPMHGFKLSILPFGIVRPFPKGIRHIIYTWKLYRKSKNVDFIYALDAVSVGVSATLVSLFRRKPLFVRLGGDYAWEQGVQRFGLGKTLDEYISQQEKAPWQVRLLAWVQLQVVRHAQKVIVPSKYLKGIVAAWGVDTNHIEVIYSVLSPLPKVIRKEGLLNTYTYITPIICSAARLTPWKGFDALIESFVEIKKEYPQATLLIVGDGPQKRSLQEKAQKLGLESFVVFTGKVSKAKLAEYITMSDVFVLNTAYEGLSHQLLEVMNMEVPIITTDIGGNPELIEHRISGMLVKYNDVKMLTEYILKLLASDSAVKEMIKVAKKRTKDFNKDTATKQLVEVFEQNI